MADWSVRSTATVSFATAANCAFTAPTIVAGDVLVATMYQEVNNAVAVTPPTGFVALTSGENAGTTPDLQYLAWYKIADGTESGTLTFTHASVYRSLAFAVYTPTVLTPALDVQSAAVDTDTTTTSFLGTSITTLTNDDLVIVACTNFNEEDETPTGSFVTAVRVVGTGGGGNWQGWEKLAVAGATGTVTVNMGASTSSVGALHAFKPGVVVDAPFPPWPYRHALRRLLRM